MSALLTPRPVALTVQVDGIPAALKAEPRWVAWGYRWEPKREAWVKRPEGKTNDRATWSAFERALSRQREEALDGIGFCLGDGWAGCDIDHCRDASSGVMLPAAQHILDALAGAYIEVSPSGTGFKAFFRAPRIGFQIDFAADGKVTSWQAGRFFAVTGVGAGDPTLDRADVIETWAPIVAIPSGARVGYSGAAATSDESLVLQAIAAPSGDKFLDLWCGKWEPHYPSHSEADLAMCRMLAFWTNYDSERIDAIFRASGLMRPKWQGSYRAATLRKAVS